MQKGGLFAGAISGKASHGRRGIARALENKCAELGAFCLNSFCFMADLHRHLARREVGWKLEIVEACRRVAAWGVSHTSHTTSANPALSRDPIGSFGPINASKRLREATPARPCQATAQNDSALSSHWPSSAHGPEAPQRPSDGAGDAATRLRQPSMLG